MIKKLLGLVLAVSVISFIAPSFVSAAGNIKAGPVKVHPYITADTAYTTNAFSTAGNRVDDYITTYTPGLSLELPFRRHSLFLDYNIVDKNYKDFSDEDTTSRNAYGLLNLKVGSRLDVSISDTYIKGHEPRGSSATGSIEEFKNNIVDARIKHALVDVSSIEFGYSGSSWSFDTAANDFRERDENTLSVAIYLKVLPKTSVFVEYALKDVDYEVIEPILGVTLDNETDFAQVGIKWDATGKSTGILKAGYSWRDYDDKTLGEHNTWVGSLEGVHNFDKYTTLTLTAARTLDETSLSGTRFTTSTGAFGELKHKFYRKFSLAARGSRTEVDFSDPLATVEKRIDRVGTVGAGFGYDMQDSLTFALNYDHTKRNSNETAKDSIDNLYSVTANFKF